MSKNTISNLLQFLIYQLLNLFAIQHFDKPELIFWQEKIY